VNVQNTVCINIKGDFDLWSATGSWGDAFKVELAKQVVVFGHSTFAFENLDKYTGLVISIGGEGLGLLCGDGSVAGDQDSHDTTCSFNTLRKRCDVEKEEIFDGF